MDSDLNILNKKLQLGTTSKSKGSSGNTIIYIITGILLIVIIAVIVVMVTKKKKIDIKVSSDSDPNSDSDSNELNRIPLIQNQPDTLPDLRNIQRGLNLDNAYLYDRNQPRNPEVFNISENIYSYHDASDVCNAFDAELATYQQLVDAYKKGAQWCNYGWTKGEMALYPTQYDTWAKLQDDPNNSKDCGMPGINGGFFENKNLLFGVNCYGIKPEPKDHEKIKRKIYSQKEYEKAKKIRDYQKSRLNMTITPFNQDNWSGCNLPQVIE